MVTRREILGSGAVVGMASMAGCLDFALGQDALEFESERAVPSDTSLNTAGYEDHEVDWQTFEEEIDFLGMERDVRARYWSAVYTKTVAIANEELDAAVFAVVTVPSMDLFGRTLNPMAAMDSEEMVQEQGDDFEADGEGIDDIQYSHTKEVYILDEYREVDVFYAKTEHEEHEGEEIDMELNVSIVDHEGDLVVLFGAYPRELPGEEAEIENLMESVRHPA